MKPGIDLRSRAAGLLTTSKWILVPLVVLVPLVAALVNNVLGLKNFLGNFGDYSGIALEMLILAGIGVYFFRLLSARNLIIDNLSDSENRYRQLFDVSPEPMVVHRNGIILLVNHAAAEAIGAESPEELKGRSVLDFAHPDSLAMVMERLHAVEDLHTGVPLIEMKVVRMDGTIIYGEGVVVPTTFDGEPAVLSVGRDISSRRLAEQSLRESEEKYRLVVDNAYEGILIIQDGEFRFVNPRVAQELGYSEEELLGKPFKSFVFLDDRQSAVEGHALRMQGDDSRRHDELRIIAREGTVLWVDLEAVPITWNGRPAGLCFVQDITDRKNAEEALKRSEKLYRSVVDRATDIIYVTDEQGNFRLFNSVGLRVIGYSQAEIAHKNYLDLIPDEYKEQVKHFYGRQFVKGIPNTYFELPIMTKEGRAVWIGQSVQLVMDGDEVVGFQAIGRDITDRKAAEEALRESEERYRAVFTNASVGINIADRDGRYVHVNTTSANMLGYNPEEMRGRTIFDVTHPDDLEASRQNLAALVQGRLDGYRTENRYVKKDGTTIWGDLSASAVRDARGEHAATLCVVVDITERKRSEEERESLKSQLLHSQKMEAVGTLAGGIAHEFNNLLTIIVGYAELLLLDTDERDSRHSDLSKIVTACRRGAELVNKIRIFGRKADYHFRPVDLNREVRETTILLGNTIPKMIRIRCELADALATVQADSAQVDQMIVNLALNSADAMPDGGSLIIKTRNVILDSDGCARIHGAKPGHYVVLSVTDIGHGMNETTLNHIFEPFFTTRGMAQRSGLGLAVVHGIVQEHGGFISYESTIGVGTTFDIYFQAMTSNTMGPQSGEHVKLGAGTETILLVDDEPSVLDVGQRLELVAKPHKRFMTIMTQAI
jgi:two-component system, cell cycle sensor histidine kinase and response regulator CckA